MQFKLITGADAKSFEDNVNGHIAELEAAGGHSISIFQPFSTDHAERFCVAIVSRDLVAEQAAHQARADKAATERAERDKAFALTPAEPTSETPIPTETVQPSTSGASGDGNGQQASDAAPSSLAVAETLDAARAESSNHDIGWSDCIEFIAKHSENGLALVDIIPLADAEAGNHPAGWIDLTQFVCDRTGVVVS